MDLPQIVLLVVILVVTVILTVIGVQLIFFLKDAKETLRKVDSILGDVQFMSNNLTRTSATVTHLVDGMKSGLELIGLATKLLGGATSKKKA